MAGHRGFGRRFGWGFGRIWATAVVLCGAPIAAEPVWLDEDAAQIAATPPIPLSTAPLAAGSSPAMAGDPPSVLLLTVDTLRADRLGSYGHRPATTPSLDRLAAEGVRFEEARAHVPLTLPSHATLLTGALPPRHGARGNGPFVLSPEVPTLAEALSARGYDTAAVVASAVLDRRHGLARGFDHYDDNQRVGEARELGYVERPAGRIVDSVAELLPRLEPPFFLWVHLYDPHLPWVAPPAFATATGDGYDGEIAFADHAVGRIRSMAEERAGGPLWIVATSDHGESLGEHGEAKHGYTLHRGVLRVPLIVAGPGVPRGRTVDATVGLVDVPATVSSWTGASLPAIDGRPLDRFWTDGSATDDGEIVWEESLHPLYDAGWAPLRGLLTRHWHVVDAPRPELYDRRRDPDDRHDLAGEQPQILERMLAKLRARAVELGDVADPAADAHAVDREHLARLASLGYLHVPRAAAGPRLDPKDGLIGLAALDRADALLDAGRGEEAAEVIDPHLRRDPTNPRLWHQSGRAWLVAGRAERARDALRRAVELAPRMDFIRSTYAAALRATGDFDAAHAEWERILADDPRAIDVALAWARSLAELRDPAAVRPLRIAYDAGARDPDQLDALAYDALRRGRRDEAADLFREALALRPGDPHARLELARQALRDGRAAEAIAVLEGCGGTVRRFECRIELARALVVGPRDPAAAREQLLAARATARDERERHEVDRRLAALDRWSRR